MVAGVGGAEGEFAGVRAFGVYDAVVVVENFVDCDCYGEVGVTVEGVCGGCVLESCVVT